MAVGINSSLHLLQELIFDVSSDNRCTFFFVFEQVLLYCKQKCFALIVRLLRLDLDL